VVTIIDLQVLRGRKSYAYDWDDDPLRSSTLSVAYSIGNTEYTGRTIPPSLRRYAQSPTGSRRIATSIPASEITLLNNRCA